MLRRASESSEELKDFCAAHFTANISCSRAERVAQEIFWMRLLQEMSTDVQRTNLSKGLKVCIKDIRYQLTKAA